MDTQSAHPAEYSGEKTGNVGGPPPCTAARRSRFLRFTRVGFERARIEAFIANEFRRHFAATVTEFMPSLAGLYDGTGSLTAAVGYRPACTGRLFLESYTTSPIEDVIRQQVGETVSRAEIVEVGSLACTGGRAAMEIVTALVPALIGEGFSWVVFTGADTVRNIFRRLSLKPVALCIANKSRLGERQHDWGSYYDHNPVVMAGRLADGIAALAPGSGAR